MDATAGQLLTVPEAARLLKVSTSTIWRWINRGELPAYRAGQRRIVLKATEIQHILTAGRQRHGEGGSTMPEPVIPLSPLTPTDVARLQAAMAQAQAIRARILQERHGRLLPSSTELLREQREQRSAQL
ncbi:MAG: helix-turn-helix domain-containing protein [Chloroflexi bacterium]|nr:helix-turn-helix domain-containing protein [Chloroflexota bacterium]